jgi:hypothetical protein
MEHKFTVPQIEKFLKEHGLAFLGFELDARVIEKFQLQYSYNIRGADALTNLEHWHAFEIANPDTFRLMYIFAASKEGDSASH